MLAWFIRLHGLESHTSILIPVVLADFLFLLLLIQGLSFLFFIILFAILLFLLFFHSLHLFFIFLFRHRFRKGLVCVMNLLFLAKGWFN